MAAISSRHPHGGFRPADSTAPCSSRTRNVCAADSCISTKCRVECPAESLWCKAWHLGWTILGRIWKHMETYGNILDNWERTLDSFSQSFWGFLFTGLLQIFPENQFTKPDITSMIWSYMALLLRDEASKNKQGIWWTYYKHRTSNGKCLGMYDTVWSCHLWGVVWVCCPILRR